MFYLILSSNKKETNTNLYNNISKTPQIILISSILFNTIY